MPSLEPTLKWRADAIVLMIVLLLVVAVLRRGVTASPTAADPHGEDAMRRKYNAIVAAEIIGVAVAVIASQTRELASQIMPLVAIPVGIHFIALAVAFWSASPLLSRRFVLTGVAVLALAGIGSAMPNHLRPIVVGAGMALILWFTVLLHMFTKSSPASATACGR